MSDQPLETVEEKTEFLRNVLRTQRYDVEECRTAEGGFSGWKIFRRYSVMKVLPQSCIALISEDLKTITLDSQAPEFLREIAKTLKTAIQPRIKAGVAIVPKG